MASRRPFSGGSWLDLQIPPRVVFEGDSLIGGYNAQVSPQDYFSIDYPSVVTFDASEGGNSVVNMNDQAATEVDPHYVAGAVAVLWGGTNDLTGFTAAETYAQIEQWCTDRKAVGFKVVVCNLIKNASLTGPQQTQLALLNSMLAADHSFADAFVDLAASIDDWTSHPTWWDSDHVHLLSAGYRVAGTLIGNAILEAA